MKTPDPASHVWCIIPAAGKGKRFGSACPKQYCDLAGKPVLHHTLERLHQSGLFTAMVLATQPNDGRALALASLFPNIIMAAGGAERHLSVRNALWELQDRAADNDFVFVHDAARPLIRPQDILKLYEAIQSDPVGGLLAVPVRDTLKQASQGRSALTLDRNSLWQAQTPQAFRFGLLRKAIEQAIASSCAVTDEAQAIEALGHQPLLVEGSPDNLKITVEQDLILAEALCA